MSKILVEINLPVANKKFDVYIPVEGKVGEILILSTQLLSELSDGNFKGDENVVLIDLEYNHILDVNKFVGETQIRNGSRLMMI
ncbi:MAG: hypothetical protein LBM93_06965 [Oscillospiraceae bacterium]|nr:hypothetical protein [Oscillospiraceae bacterium]